MGLLYRISWVLGFTLLLSCSEQEGGLTVQTAETEDDTSSSERSPDDNCQTDSQFMANEAWPRVFSQCTACHNSGGLAGQSDLILINNSAEFETNFASLKEFEAISPSLLLAKAMTNGVTHGGGRLINQGDSHYDTFNRLLTRFANPIEQCDESPDTTTGSSNLDARTLIGQLALTSPAQTYRQLALLLSAHLPSDTQLASITEQNLKTSVRDLMQGQYFDAFIREAANDQLLTLKWANSRTSGLSALNGEYFYPFVNSRISALETLLENAAEADKDTAAQAVWDAITQTNLALAQEPLRLINHVINQEHPYSEVLSANYILVNPYSNDVFNTGLAFADPMDSEDWQAAQINSGYRNGNDLPHAGILTSPMFLARYPSTETNRNRARARWTYYFFLGLNIEGLATRPMNSDSLMDVDNPTLNNPDCAVCHEIMDPVAGAFQNWGNDGQFRDQCGWFPDSNHVEGGEWLCDQDALPWVGYKEFFDPYEVGDLWYRDMRAVGFNGTTLPSTEKNHSLRWLANELINDDRFAMGTVKFWFKGVFGREAFITPTDNGQSQFQSLLAAYEIDQLYLHEFSTAFANGNAGTASHGAFNLKDLLVDMLTSPLFRAQQTLTTINADDQAALANIGQGRLLTPEQLNRKLYALLGKHWSHVWDDTRNQLTEDFYGFYGGIDSDGVTDRNTQLNTLMATVIERLSSEMVCRVVIDEFELQSSARLLFASISLTDTPETQAGIDKIKLTIAALIRRLWGEGQDSVAEVQAAYDLFVNLRNERLENNATVYFNTSAEQESTDEHDEFCILDWDNENALRSDDNQVARSWMGLLIYLLSDYQVLYM